MSESRPSVFIRALQTAVGLGDEDPSTLFTEDVLAWSPALMASSLAELAEALKVRDEALSNVSLTIRSFNMGGNRAIAEWRLDADHTGPLTVDDELTLEATGRHVHVGGATFAEFRGHKIRAFRSYFDEMALMEQVMVPD
jgi:predicted ester cyclase